MAMKLSKNKHTTPLVSSGSEMKQEKTFLSECLRRLASSLGFVAGGYHSFGIDLALQMLVLEYTENVVGPAQKGILACISYAGIVSGQVIFGALADYIGRKYLFLLVAVMTSVGSAGGCAIRNPSGLFNLPFQFGMLRFLLGLGIGGEYPLSAAVMADAAGSPEERARDLVSVYQMQSWGMFLACLVTLIVISCGASLSVTWRVLLFCSGLPGMLAFALRWNMQESAAFQRSQAHTQSEGNPDTPRKNHWNRLKAAFGAYKLWLFGCSVNWFIANLVLFSFGAFKGHVFDRHLGEDGSVVPVRYVMRNARMGLLTSLWAIGGFLLAFALINRFGRYHMQLFGFVGMSCVFLLLAWTEKMSHVPFPVILVLVGLVFFFQNFGPNTTTFVIPGEIFPTHVRATFVGISGAVGKVGGLVGALGFPLVQEWCGLTCVYILLAAVNVLGVGVTIWATPLEPPSEEYHENILRVAEARHEA